MCLAPNPSKLTQAPQTLTRFPNALAAISNSVADAVHAVNRGERSADVRLELWRSAFRRGREGRGARGKGGEAFYM